MPGSAGNKDKGDLVVHMRSSSLFNGDPQLENAQKERKTLAQRLGGQRGSGHGPKSTRLSCTREIPEACPAVPSGVCTTAEPLLQHEWPAASTPSPVPEPP